MDICRGASAPVPLMDTQGKSSCSQAIPSLKCGSSDKAVQAMSEAYDEMTKHIADTKASAKFLSDILQGDPSQDPVGTIRDMLGKTTECFVECTQMVQSLDNMMILSRMDQDDASIKALLFKSAPPFKRLVALNKDLRTFIASKRMKKEA